MRVLSKFSGALKKNFRVNSKITNPTKLPIFKIKRAEEIVLENKLDYALLSMLVI